MSEEELDDESDASDKPKKKAPARGKANNKPTKMVVGGGKDKNRPQRATAGKSKAKNNSSDEDDKQDESEDDEPLSKKSKNSPPTVSFTEFSIVEPNKQKFYSPQDDEIKNFLKEVLDEADLEEITMKTVCKKVYAKYPEHDLTHKKDFIKATVKSVSTLSIYLIEKKC